MIALMNIARGLDSWWRAILRRQLARAIVRGENHLLYLEDSIEATRAHIGALRVKLAVLEDRL